MRGVLTYHAIDTSGSALSVTPQAFRAHIAWLAKGDVQVIPLPDLLALPDTTNAVALTFDDALASVAAEAAPVLAAHGFAATIFVVTRHAGGDNRWNGAGDAGIPVHAVLGWSALAKLKAEGFTIGAHTRQHRHLTHCSPTELDDELGGSADDIAAALGERPTTFAYPYGSVDDRVARAVRNHFAIGCTTVFQPVSAATQPDRVPRLDAWYFADPRRLECWGTAGFRRSVAFRHTLRRARRMFR